MARTRHRKHQPTDLYEASAHTKRKLRQREALNGKTPAQVRAAERVALRKAHRGL